MLLNLAAGGYEKKSHFHQISSETNSSAHQARTGRAWFPCYAINVIVAFGSW